MPWRCANASALPNVGEATATTSASSGIAFTDAAMQSAWNREPTIPIFTFDTLCPSVLSSNRRLIDCPAQPARRDEPFDALIGKEPHERDGGVQGAGDHLMNEGSRYGEPVKER